MIEISCDICTTALDRPGALVFGPPDEHGNTKKRHVCVPCWQKGPNLEAIVAAVQDDQERELLQEVVDASRSWLGAWSTNVGRRREPEAGPIDDLIAAITALDDLTPELDSDDQNLAEHTAATRAKAVQGEVPEGMASSCQHCGFKITWHPTERRWYRQTDGSTGCGSSANHQPLDGWSEPEPPRTSIDRCVHCGKTISWGAQDNEWRGANDGSIGCLARMGYPPSSGGHSPAFTTRRDDPFKGGFL